jgi:acetolactate synthase-1/3 small subunit
MAMRRGHHTSRVLKALGTKTNADTTTDLDPDALPEDETLPAEFGDND